MNLWILCTAAALLTLSSPLGAQSNPYESDADLDGVPGLAAPPASPHPAVPSILVKTGSILVDHSHQNDFNVSGFTDFLESEGWTIEQHLAGPITPAVLEGHDILLVPTRSSTGPNDPFLPPEIASVQDFLAQGHGLWMLHDYQDPAAANVLSSGFGVEFQYDVVRDPSNNEGQLFWPTIHEFSPHPVTDGVETYGYYLGDCLVVSAPATAIARGDEDAYSIFCPAGSTPVVLAAWENQGRAIFAGDQTPLHPTYYPERLRDEEQLLLQSIVNWLLGDAPTPADATTWGGVKRAFGTISP